MNAGAIELRGIGGRALVGNLGPTKVLELSRRWRGPTDDSHDRSSLPAARIFNENVTPVIVPRTKVSNT